MSAFVMAETSDRRFEKYNASDGLADNSAQTIYCTKEGRMVITTMGQINFFDGQKFSYIDPTEENLYPLVDYAGNYHLYFDRYHHMWLKNTHNVTCVDLQTEKFAVSIKEEFAKFGMDKQVRDMFVDADGIVWLSVEDGLYSVESKRLYPLRKGHNLQDVETSQDKYLLLFYEDGQMDMVDLTTGKRILLSAAYNNTEKETYESSSVLLKDHNLLQAITRVNRPYGDNKYGYIIDFADIKQNFDETNEAYMKELNRFNDPEETGMTDLPSTFAQVIEDKASLIQQMKDVRQSLFNYSTDNVEEFSLELSSVEEKEELLKLKKALISARDCYNMVRTFGDDDLKETFEKLKVEKVSDMIREVQRAIDNMNQKEAFENAENLTMLVNEAMQGITFNFSKLGEEEMRIIGGGEELHEKLSTTLREFSENIDHEDPEYITLLEAFRARFKEHGFNVQSVNEFNQYSKALDEFLKKLEELKRKNKNLMNKYNGDAKFARVHKRIMEANKERTANGEQPIVSGYDQDVVDILVSIKADVDQKVYDRNDILKKDDYFEKTVMVEISNGMDKLNIANTRADRRILTYWIMLQYMNQYREVYPAA